MDNNNNEAIENTGKSNLALSATVLLLMNKLKEKNIKFDDADNPVHNKWLEQETEQKQEEDDDYEEGERNEEKKDKSNIVQSQIYPDGYVSDNDFGTNDDKSIDNKSIDDKSINEEESVSTVSNQENNKKKSDDEMLSYFQKFHNDTTEKVKNEKNEYDDELELYLKKISDRLTLTDEGNRDIDDIISNDDIDKFINKLKKDIIEIIGARRRNTLNEGDMKDKIKNICTSILEFIPARTEQKDKEKGVYSGNSNISYYEIYNFIMKSVNLRSVVLLDDNGAEISTKNSLENSLTIVESNLKKQRGIINTKLYNAISKQAAKIENIRDKSIQKKFNFQLANNIASNCLADIIKTIIYESDPKNKSIIQHIDDFIFDKDLGLLTDVFPRSSDGKQKYRHLKFVKVDNSYSQDYNLERKLEPVNDKVHLNLLVRDNSPIGIKINTFYGTFDVQNEFEQKSRRDSNEMAISHNQKEKKLPPPTGAPPTRSPYNVNNVKDVISSRQLKNTNFNFGDLPENQIRKIGSHQIKEKSVVPNSLFQSQTHRAYGNPNQAHQSFHQGPGLVIPEKKKKDLKENLEKDKNETLVAVASKQDRLLNKNTGPIGDSSPEGDLSAKYKQRRLQKPRITYGNKVSPGTGGKRKTRKNRKRN